MADLTIAGTDYRVIRDSWRRKPSLYQGGRQRMRDNSLLSTETAEKRVFECQVDWLDATEEATFRTNVVRGFSVSISGDLPGDIFAGIIDIGDTQLVLVTVNGTDSLLRTATLHIEEV